MRIHVAADHAGYELKVALVEHLQGAGHEVVDHGAHEYDAQDDYPPMCIEAGEAVVADPGSLGVVIGGIVTSTLLTLIVLPTLYELIEARAARDDD